MNRIPTFRLVVASAVLVSSLLAIETFAQPAVSDVTVTGLITCAHCLDLGQHKGFTPWSWAMYKVSQGDNIVVVASGNEYNLQGDRRQLSKYMLDKVTIAGHLNANTIEVTSIARPPKER